MAEVKKDISVMNEKMDNMTEKMDAFIESCDSKFADKNVEKIVYGMVALILTSFATGLIYLVMN